jgi:dihydrofolate synthase / folylpolyglutamate synthase
LQLVKTNADRQILLDGAHNVGSAEALRAALKIHLKSPNPTLILGILRDKDSQPMCKILAPLAGRILLVPVSSQRTASPQELGAMCRKANAAAEIYELGSLAEAFTLAGSDPFVVITGSLYLVGEAMELLGPSFTNSCDERKLNEWNTSVPTSIKDTTHDGESKN